MSADIPQIVRSWLEEATSRYDIGDLGRYLDPAVTDLLARTAHVLNRDRDVTLVAEPGNGTRYLMHLALLRPEDALLSGGGRLLAALPTFHRCLTLHPTALHTPDYIAEKLKLALTDCIVIASYLSLLADPLKAEADGTADCTTHRQLDG